MNCPCCSDSLRSGIVGLSLFGYFFQNYLVSFVCTKTLYQNCFWVLFCLLELFKLSVVLVGSKLDQFDSYFLRFLLLLFLFV